METDAGVADERSTAGPYRVQRFVEVEDFLDRAGDFLETHEAEDCLILGLATNIRLGVQPLPEPPCFAVVTGPGDREGIAAASLQTPPHNVVVSIADDLEAVDALADALTGEDLPGVGGPSAVASRFAERWTARTGRRHARVMAERIYRLSAVREPRPAPGRMRPAEQADRPLLLAWIEAFFQEALGESTNPEDSVDRWLAGEGRILYLWQDGEIRVSLCGVGGSTPNGIRVGPVYTPPEYRGRGYASNLVTRVSEAQLDLGRRFVFLFTDLANPTSNRIYQDVGYEPVIDVDLYRFGD